MTKTRDVNFKSSIENHQLKFFWTEDFLVIQEQIHTVLYECAQCVALLYMNVCT